MGNWYIFSIGVLTGVVRHLEFEIPYAVASVNGHQNLDSTFHQ